MLKLSLAAAIALLSFNATAFAQATADAPVASASDAALDAQISSYLNASAQPLPSTAGPNAMGPSDPLPDRKVHGEVGVAVGTGGYREAYASMIAPMGSNGTVAVAVSQVQGRGRWGPAGAQSLSIAASMGPGGGAGLGGRSTACAGPDDKTGFEPLWAAQMRAARPAAQMDCPTGRTRP
ncbi:MAG TPA: hypothetical protein VL358_04330 [Caulobacteraceae bacterium]|jgi:hypothetical protein|nr:hypothetical protein [Caulobacteraceae bacterium]